MSHFSAPPKGLDGAAGWRRTQQNVGGGSNNGGIFKERTWIRCLTHSRCDEGRDENLSAPEHPATAPLAAGSRIRKSGRAAALLTR